LTPICTKSFVGALPQTPLGSLQHSLTPLVVFRGPASKRMGREKRKRKGRGGEGREGVHPPPSLP